MNPEKRGRIKTRVRLRCSVADCPHAGYGKEGIIASLHGMTRAGSKGWNLSSGFRSTPSEHKGARYSKTPRLQYGNRKRR